MANTAAEKPPESNVNDEAYNFSGQKYGETALLRPSGQKKVTSGFAGLTGYLSINVCVIYVGFGWHAIKYQIQRLWQTICIYCNTHSYRHYDKNGFP